MSLTYMSGDKMGKSKRSGGGGKASKSKGEKKKGKGRIFKKVAKVALAPSRAAFLTVVRLNGLGLAVKIARVWNKSAKGKQMITNFWEKFGGDVNKLKATVNKAKKVKVKMNKDQIGSATAIAAAIASATPIIVALMPIIKQMKAGGDKKEQAEFAEGVEDGKRALADSEDVIKSVVSMPRNKDVGYVADKYGDAQTDKNVGTSASEEVKSGGTRGEGEGTGGGKTEQEQKEEAEQKMNKASNWSPLGLFFMTLMYISQSGIDNLFTRFISSYCLIGMVLIPAALQKNPFQRIAKLISFTPIVICELVISKLNSQWQKRKIIKLQ